MPAAPFAPRALTRLRRTLGTGFFNPCLNLNIFAGVLHATCLNPPTSRLRRRDQPSGIGRTIKRYLFTMFVWLLGCTLHGFVVVKKTRYVLAIVSSRTVTWPAARHPMHHDVLCVFRVCRILSARILCSTQKQAGTGKAPMI